MTNTETDQIDEFSYTPNREQINLTPLQDPLTEKVKRLSRLLVRAKSFLTPNAVVLIKDIEGELES